MLTSFPFVHSVQQPLPPPGSPKHSSGLLMPYQPHNAPLGLSPQQLSPQPARSPKMGRRALQRPQGHHGHKASPSSSPSPELVTETVTTVVEELVVRGLPPGLPPGLPAGGSSAPSSSPKGLDRVLMERNLERLLSDHGPTVNLDQLAALSGLSPDLERLLSSRDRCRQPLHLAELSLSLDSWQPFSEALGARPEHRASMPELDAPPSQPPPPPPPPPQHGHTSSPASPSTPSTPTTPDGPATNATTPPSTQPSTSSRGKNRGQLSVRFEDGNDCNSPAGDGRPRDSTKEAARERRAETRKARRARHSRDYDEDSYCSTCSSSSSSDESDAYQLPPRRAYGGVRISYVPNDALACARQRQQAAAMPRSPVKKSGGAAAGPNAPAHALNVADKNCIIS